MKALIPLIAALLLMLAGCDFNHSPVITNKRFSKGSVCFYNYDGLGTSGAGFYDSCSYYRIGDTIKQIRK